LKSGRLKFLESSGPVQVCNGIASIFTIVFTSKNYYLKKKMQNETDDWKEEGAYACGQCVVYSIFIANV